jgi:hypothetical protein
MLLPSRWFTDVYEGIANEKDPRYLRRRIWDALGRSLGSRAGEINTRQGSKAAEAALRDIRGVYPDIAELRTPIDIYDRCLQFCRAQAGQPYAVCSLRMAELRNENEELRQQVLRLSRSSSDPASADPGD